ncbi:MAG TPA: UDP-3-O-(3-hydroxymyristoyl)glucosamine N-acyltransferase [Verrucomicrobiae bacterium]|nr:UDP-3-O-(3-hydroxymyristoyl)glucosamine N-acyltransferase [Verrucomicrobiae bacterium]
MTAAEIAKLLGGEVIGNGSLDMTGFAPADRAQPGDLTFAENENYFARAEQSAASAVIVDGSFTSSRGKTLIRVPNARIAFAKVLPLFFPEPVFQPGLHPTALIATGAQVDPTAHVGPYCVVGNKVRIGPRTVLQGGNHIAPGCILGEEVNLFPNVVLYPNTEIGNRVRVHSGTVIGSDGFGYVQDGGVHRKVPQIGSVLIRDDVEIGANVTIDRGALGPTIIGRGTKIDNLVQIAHNVTVGEHCLVVSQAGIAGSTRLGNYVILAGQAGLAGHLKIGNRASVGAQSGVMSNIPDGEKWLWTPAQPDRQAKRQMIALQQLPDLLRRFNELEKKLEAPTQQPPANPS